MGSCMIVEAEVHTPDSRVPKNIVETLSVSVYPALTVQVSKNKETAESFATSMDFIQVLESPKKPKQNEKPQASQCKKPRWSLRINLPSEEQDNDAGNYLFKFPNIKKKTCHIFFNLMDIQM